MNLFILFKLLLYFGSSLGMRELFADSLCLMRNGEVERRSKPLRLGAGSSETRMTSAAPIL